MKNFINRALVAKKHLKLFFALFAMLALGVGNAWGETVTFTPSNCTNWTDSQAEQTQTIDGITLHSTGAANNTQLRLYSGATHTFTSTVGNITSILFTCTANGTSNYGPGKMTGDGYVAGTGKTGEWTGNSAEVTLKGGQSRCTSIVVTYTPSSSGGGENPGEDGGEDPEEPETPVNPTPGIGGTVTYTVSSVTEVTTTGNVPQGSTAVLSGTGSLSSGFIQCSNGKNHTLTLTGYEGYMITGVTIHVKSNSSKGTGSFSVMAGATTIASITESAFNTSSWNGSWNTTGVDKTLTMTNDSYKIQSGENVTLTINCKSGGSSYNSLYVKSYTITYKPVSSSGSGTEEPVASLVQIAHTGDKTTFTEGDAFVKSTITATYDDGTTKDVTSLATFTGYDMNTTGTQTITVTYEGKTTTYDITVNPKPTYTITWNNAGSTTETTVKQGETFGELPTVLNCPNGKKFMGWTAATSINNDGSGVTYIKSTDKPTANTTYYAVFAVVEGGDATPTTATVSIASCGWTDKTKYTTLSIDEYITASVSDGTNTGTFYSNGNNWRLYQTESATLTISATAGYEIQTVKVTYANSNNGVLTLSGSNITSETASEVNAESVTFGVGNTGSETNGQVRITAIEVTYVPAAKTSDYSLDCTINTNPEWTIETDEISFADKYVGVSYTETFTINASNLTDAIDLAIDGSNYTVSPTSIATDAEFPQTVTVTYAPTAAGSHNATLNITSGSTLSKSITLTGSATEATIYTLTALADIKPTDKVIIVGTSGGSTYAMSNDKGTSEAPDAIAVTVTDNKIATDKTNILWNIAKNGENLIIYPADQTAKWLYCLADANDGVRVGTGDAKEFSIDKGYLYATKTTTPRHIGIYSNSDWRCYKPSADAIHTNIKDQSFAFYVLPDTKPSISVPPASGAFGVLTVGETATQEIEITALNITQALTAEITGDGFKSKIEDNKITITFAPTEVKEYSATLTIRAGTEASASVTLTGKGVAATYSVTYDKNGADSEAPTDDNKYVADDKVTVAGQGEMTKAGYRFAGWKYGEDTYKAGATFKMPAENVTFVAQWVEKQKFDAGYWVLVTDASELNADDYDYVVIAAADYNVAMKSYESGKNNCGQIGVTKANNLLIWNENVGVFQLTKSSEKYTFRDVNTELYLYASGGTSSNQLKASSFPTEGEFDKYYWTISIADGKATIKANVTETGARNWLRYNDTESGKLFSCYASGQKDIALYKYVTELPTIELNSDDNSTVITANAGKTVNVKLNRSFNTSGWGTLCVPFEMSASVIGEAYELGTITKHQTGAGINLNLAKVETIEAGKPYLIKANVPSLDVIKNVTIVNTIGSSYTVTGDGIKITFTGLINGDGQTDGSTEYYVGANDGYLYNATVDKLGLRALFTITDEAGNPTKVRARVVTREDAATGFENITNGENTTIKVIDNGQLIIIRDDVKYNVQGQRL